MFRRTTFALLAGLAITAPSFADAITTNVTINAPGSPSQGDVIHFDVPANGGIAYTNVQNGNGPAAPGNTLVAVGGGQLLGSTLGPPPGSTGAFPMNGGNNIFAVFALKGTFVGTPTQLAAQFTSGVVQFYNAGAGRFGNNDPLGVKGGGNAAWVSGPPLATYTLSFQAGPNAGVHQTVLAGATTGAFNGAQVTQPGATQDMGFAALSGAFNGFTNALFTRTSATTIFPANVPPGSVGDGLFDNTPNTLLNVGTGGTNGLTAADMAQLDAIVSSFLGAGNTFNTGTDTFNPQGNFSNGDASESVGLTFYPVFFTPNITVPEPVSIFLWGLGAAGLVAYRARRKRKGQTPE